jgi:lysophospholipase L1-like esterase
MRDLCTVDALHPNDLGQFIMAEEVYKTLAMALKR